MSTPDTPDTLHILIVDDIEQNLYMLDFMLRNAGYQVHQACNGKLAIEILNSTAIDLIVSDILMPEMDGYQLCRACKAHEQWRDIPFIFYTATYTTKEDETFALGLGAARFILKPQQPRAFLTVIREVLADWKGGTLQPQAEQISDEETYLKLYNQRLVHKLEDKLKQLEGKNQTLSKELLLRQQAEEQTSILLSAIEHTDEGIIVCDPDGKISYVNTALTHITGYSREALMVLNPVQLNSDTQPLVFYRQLWQSTCDGKSWQGRLLDQRKHGESYPIMLSITPIHVGSERITHYIAIIQDMSEQEALEERFLQAQKLEAVGTLAGGIAHDFNNFLATLSISTYLAEKQIHNPETVRGCLRNINTASERAAELVKQMLTFARKDRVKMEPLSIKDSISTAIRLARAGLPENIRLTQHLGNKDPFVFGSSTQIEQILLNMLNNARDALEHTDKPEITITLEQIVHQDPDEPDGLPAGTYARLCISDNGEGIKDPERIYEPFFTTKEQGKGTGLGLAMVYGSVVRHKGSISVESEQGNGCCFTIDIPVCQSVSSTEPGEEKPLICGAGKLILLADDEDFVRQTMRELLEHLGFRVAVVEDGKQALTYLQGHSDQVALAVLDVIMPVMSGADAARKMRKIRNDLPILFITGYDRNHVLDLEQQRFAHCAVIGKPFRIGQLSDELATLLPELKGRGNDKSSKSTGL